jgi:hypothetical protein
MQQDYAQFVLKVYSETLQQMKKNCETAGQLVQNMAAPERAKPAPVESPRTAAQNPATQFFRRVVESQMSLCRFFEHRWSNYTALPDAIASCKSPLDVLPLQASFLKQFANDYANQGAQMMQAFWPWAARPVSGGNSRGL